jgi:hypothetical protein
MGPLYSSFSRTVIAKGCMNRISDEVIETRRLCCRKGHESDGHLGHEIDGRS